MTKTRKYSTEEKNKGKTQCWGSKLYMYLLLNIINCYNINDMQYYTNMKYTNITTLLSPKTPAYIATTITVDYCFFHAANRGRSCHSCLMTSV